MRRLSVTSIAIVALVVLAGCGVFAGSGPSPPGVQGAELVNRTALYDAHQEAIVADGAVIRIRGTTDLPAGQNLTRVLYVEPHMRRFLIVTKWPNNTIATELWGNGSVAVRRSLRGTVRVVPTDYHPSVAYLTGLRWVREWLGPTEPIHANQSLERNGRRLRQLVGHRETPSGSPPIRFRLAVDGDGRIWSGRYSTPVGSGSHTRTVVYNLTAVGNVSLGTPRWVAEGLAG